MRLNLYEKNKNIWLYTLIAFMLPFIVLHVVQLRVYAASSSGPSTAAVTQLPLPYGPGTGYGYSLSDNQLQDLITTVLSNYQRFAGGNNEPVTYIYMIEEQPSQNRVLVRATRGSLYITRDNRHSYPDFFNFSGLSYDNLNVTGSGYSFYYYFDGSIEFTWDGSFNNTDTSNWFELGPSGSYTLKKNIPIYGYPLYHTDYPNIINGMDVIFTHDLPGGGNTGGFDAPGFGSGTFLPSDDPGGSDGFDAPGFDFNFNLDLSVIGDRLDALQESLGSWFDPIHDKLDSIIGKLDDILDNIGAILDRMSPNNLTTQNFGDATGYLLNNFVKNSPAFKQWVDLGTSFKDFYDELFDDSDFENPVYDDNFPVVEFDMWWDMPIMDDHPEWDGWSQNIKFTADFRWYERIREPFLKVFMTFFTIGFLFYAIKQVPNILHGAAGGVSNGSSVAEGIHDIATLHPKKKGGD